THHDFVDFILEALERRKHAHFLNDHIIAQNTDAGTLLHTTFGNPTTGNPANLGNVKHLKDFGITEEGFTLDRRQHTRKHTLNVVDQVIDDRIVADFHAFTFGQIARLLTGADVKADDR